MSTIKLRMERTTQEMIYAEFPVPADADISCIGDWTYNTKWMLYRNLDGDWKEVKLDIVVENTSIWDAAISLSILDDDGGVIQTIQAPSFAYAANDNTNDDDS